MARTMMRETLRTAASEANGNSSGSTPLPLASARRRRPSWVVAGVALVAFAALVGAWVFSTTTSTMRVLVAARDLGPGDEVAATDLRVVELGRTSVVRAISPSQQDLIVGRAARGPIPTGTVLNTDLFVDRDRVVPAGSVVVGAALAAGATPTARLAAGDRVTLLAVAKTNGAAADDAAPSTVLTLGTVWAVEAPTSTGGQSSWWVSLLVPSQSQTAVAQAAADGRLRLSLAGTSG
jgi:Flp pilus assembly protein CpaB